MEQVEITVSAPKAKLWKVAQAIDADVTPATAKRVVHDYLLRELRTVFRQAQEAEALQEARKNYEEL